jgi:hypothetical protein
MRRGFAHGAGGVVGAVVVGAVVVVVVVVVVPVPVVAVCVDPATTHTTAVTCAVGDPCG